MTAKWWQKQVYTDRKFVNSVAYPDLVDARRFFWSFSPIAHVLRAARRSVFAMQQVGSGGRAREGECKARQRVA